jgi:hypothetical protein
MVALSNFLNETPVIETGPHWLKPSGCRTCARRRLSWRTNGLKLVDPLNTQVAEINRKYKSVHNTDSKKPGTLDKILGELKARLTAYALAEEAKRAREAEALRARR